MPAELFNLFPPRRPSPDGDVPAEVVAMLRVLARQAAEAGADPQALVAADLELLMVCDNLIMLARQVDEAEAAWQKAPSSRHHPANEEYRRRKQALRPAMRRAGKLQAVTPVGLFAKATAVRRVGRGAAELAVSLAADLLASPALRAAIWPLGER